MKVKIWCSFILIFCCFFNAQSQELINYGHIGPLSNLQTTGDNNGNFFLLGHRESPWMPIYAESEAGVDTLSSSSTNPSYNAFYLVKFDASGALLWSRNWEVASMAQYDWKLAADQLGNPVIGGTCMDSIDLDPGVGSDIRQQAFGRFQFVLKLDTDGNYVWGHSTELSTELSEFNLAVDHSNNVYCAGSFRDSLDLVYNSGELLVLSEEADSLPWSDLYIEKILPNGTIDWASRIGQIDYSDRISSMLGKDNGFIMSAQIMVDSFDIDPTSNHQYVDNPHPMNYGSSLLLKLDDTGIVTNWDVFYSDISFLEVQHLYSDDGNEFYFTGLGWGTIQSVNSGYNETTSDLEANFVGRLSGNTVNWMHYFPNSLTFESATIEDNFLLSGSFSDTVDFDPSSGVHQEIFVPTPFTNKTTFILELELDGDFTNVYRTYSPANFGESIADNGQHRFIHFEYFEDSLTNLPFGTQNEMVSMGVPQLSNAFYIWDNEYASLSENTTERFIAYPNPASDNVTILLSSEFNNPEIVLRNMQGNSVMQFYGINNDQFEIDVTNLADGVYFLELLDHDSFSSKKIVVAKK